jgi:hypothetical protein
MKMKPRSIMFPVETWKTLRKMALRQSLDSGRDVTVSSLVRELVEGYLKTTPQGPAGLAGK